MTNFMVAAKFSLIIKGLLIFLFVLPASLFAEDSDEVARVVSKMNSLKSFRCSVSISTGESMLRGILSFENGKSNFRMSDGRVISGNGRDMIVFDPSSGVAGKQKMAPGGGGLGWVLNGYKTKVSGRQAHLISERGGGIKEVRLSWNEDHLLKTLSILRNDSERWTTITLGDIRTVQGFPSNIFTYKPPAGSRVVDNPLDSRY